MQRLAAALVTAVMLLTAGWTAFFAVEQYRLADELADARLSLETSQGRGRRQDSEYAEVTAALPEAQAQLAELQPQADASSGAVAALKAERKALRSRKKELEAALAPAENGEAVP